MFVIKSVPLAAKISIMIPESGDILHWNEVIVDMANFQLFILIAFWVCITGICEYLYACVAYYEDIYFL